MGWTGCDIPGASLAGRWPGLKSVWQANMAGLRTEWGLEITLLRVFDIFTQKVKQLSQNKSFMIRTFSLQN